MSVRLTPIAERCLDEIERRALDLAEFARTARMCGQVDIDRATSLLMEQLSCLSLGFDDDADPLMLQRAIQACGFSRVLPGAPANDTQPLEEA